MRTVLVTSPKMASESVVRTFMTRETENKCALCSEPQCTYHSYIEQTAVCNIHNHTCLIRAAWVEHC